MKRVLTVCTAAVVGCLTSFAVATADSTDVLDSAAVQAALPGSAVTLLRSTSFFGFSLGVVLWLSVAVIAAVSGFVAVHRGKSAATEARSATVLTLADAVPAVR